MYTERDQFPSPSKASKKAARNSNSNSNTNNTFPLISSFSSSSSSSSSSTASHTNNNIPQTSTAGTMNPVESLTSILSTSSSSSSSATTHDTVGSELVATTISVTPPPNFTEEKGTTESHIEAETLLSSEVHNSTNLNDDDRHDPGDDAVMVVPMVVDQPLSFILSSSSNIMPTNTLTSNTAYSDTALSLAPALPTPTEPPISQPSLSYLLSMTRSTVPLPPIPGLTTVERILWLTPSTTNTSSSAAASSSCSSSSGTDLNTTQHQSTQFKPPVYLAPLIRKRFKRRLLPGRKIPVPLIEPEICDVYDVPFLPMSILSKGGYAADSGWSLVEDKWVLRQTAAAPLAPPSSETDGTVGADTSIPGVRADGGQRGEQSQSIVLAAQPLTVADQSEAEASIENNNTNMIRDAHDEYDTARHSSGGSSSNGHSSTNGQSAKRSRLTIDSGHTSGADDKIP